MSRSLRHTAITGNTTARSERSDKRAASRKLRVATRAAMRSDAEVMPALREVSSVWSFAKDGKHWWPEATDWKWRNR